MKILHLDASGRHEGSKSRELTRKMIAQLQTEHPEAQILYRDLAQGLPYVQDNVIQAIYDEAPSLSASDQHTLAVSETLIEELHKADIYVMGVPLYNFSMPASYKAYADLIARPGLSFKMDESGVEGLLKGKKAYFLMTSGGTEIESEQDFLSPWLKQFWNFLGVQDLHFIAAEALDMQASEAEVRQQVQAAKEEIVAQT